MKRVQTYTRAKISILSELMSFPTTRNKDWSDSFSQNHVQKGDLVAMSSAPPSKYYLSWVEEIEDFGKGYRKWLLKSIEDHSLCWWENIGLCAYDRKTVAKRDQWKWSDQQFKFQDKWRRTCFGKHDAYLILPGPTTFNGESVNLTIRERWGGMREKPLLFKKLFLCGRKPQSQ